MVKLLINVQFSGTQLISVDAQLLPITGFWHQSLIVSFCNDNTEEILNFFIDNYFQDFFFIFSSHFFSVVTTSLYWLELMILAWVEFVINPVKLWDMNGTYPHLHSISAWYGWIKCSSIEEFNRSNSHQIMFPKVLKFKPLAGEI